MTREELISRFPDRVLTEEEIAAAFPTTEIEVFRRVNPMTYIPFITFSGVIVLNEATDSKEFDELSELIALLLKYSIKTD